MIVKRAEKRQLDKCDKFKNVIDQILTRKEVLASLVIEC